jgi:hypothetical protein
MIDKAILDQIGFEPRFRDIYRLAEEITRNGRGPLIPQFVSEQITLGFSSMRKLLERFPMKGGRRRVCVVIIRSATQLAAEQEDQRIAAAVEDDSDWIDEVNPQDIETIPIAIEAEDPLAEETTSLAMATPSVATPSVATPSVATPSVATPSVATPSVATPSVATPAVATPSVATPSVATPSVTTRRANSSRKRRRGLTSPSLQWGQRLRRRLG